jgi:Cof subfamily protein (haloacid dehalogenase superfamily)
MGIFSDVLLTVDFDRTLTGPDAVIPRRNFDAIRYFMENGGAFTVNTGRSVPMFSAIPQEVPHNAPLLLYNGSAAYGDGEVSLVHAIDLPMYETMAEVAGKFPMLNLELQGIHAHYRLKEDPKWDWLYEGVGCAHDYAWPGRDIGPFLKFTLFGEIQNNHITDMFRRDPEEELIFDEAEKWLKERFGDAVSVFRAGPRIIDVHAAGVSKARAARELQERLGKKILVCVGDAENDITMLRAAGTGVALGNATPEAKAAADYVTDDIDADGVYNALVYLGIIA